MLIENYTDDLFIRAYNSFGDYHSKYFLSDEEFYIYCYLFTCRMYDESIRTSVKEISEFMTYQFYKNQTKNRDKVKNILLSLIGKGVYIIKNNVVLDNIKNDTIVVLTINDNGIMNDQVKDDNEKGKYKNYYGLPFTKLLEYNPRQLYIYFVVARYDYTGGFICSYAEWEKILRFKETRNHSSAIRVIGNMVKDGIIYMNTGDYIKHHDDGILLQNKNAYGTKPFSELQKTKQQKKKDAANTLGDYGNWNDWNSFITENDIGIYLKNKDALQDIFDKRMNVLKKYNKRAYDEFMDMIRVHNKNSINEIVLEMLKANIDSVLVVNGNPVYVKDWDGKGSVESYHYRKYKYDPIVMDAVLSDYDEDNPTQDDIQLYRPVNGEWKYDRDVLTYDNINYDKHLLLPETNKSVDEYSSTMEFSVNE